MTTTDPDADGGAPPRIIHPLVFAVIPVLFLYAYNRNQPVPLTEVAALMVASAAIAGVLWGIGHLALRDATRAAILSSFVTLLLLSYGHVVLHGNNWRRSLDLPPLHAHAPLFLVPWAFLLVAGAAYVVRARRTFRDATRLLNFVSVNLVVLTAVGTVVATGGVPALMTDPVLDPGEGAPSEDPPNVYYVVPDMFPNGHVLRDLYGYDNGAFANALRERGFHVPEETRANYPRTFLSLASTLNLRYLDDLPEIVGEDSQDERLPYRMIGNSTLARYLQGHGYRYVHFNSGWLGSEWSPLSDEVVECGTSSEFERMVHLTTVLALRDSLLHGEQRARLECQFDALAALPAEIGDAGAPRFVFAHVISPHGPFVFDADGNPVDELAVMHAADDPEEAKRQMFVEQTAYVSARLLEFVDAVVAHDPGAIVVIQSDHGPDLLGDWEDPSPTFLRERTRTFLAVRAPGHDAEALVGEDVTNVNTFRVLLDAYFGTDLGPLADRVHYSKHSTPYRFVNVTAETAFR